MTTTCESASRAAKAREAASVLDPMIKVVFDGIRKVRNKEAPPVGVGKGPIVVVDKSLPFHSYLSVVESQAEQISTQFRFRCAFHSCSRWITIQFVLQCYPEYMLSLTCALV